ncbi:MAG TPA: hypothetical protein VEB19_10785 [Gemmatimonadaceae bacterium]|nr:hypothetical protein [Gemmatimonadaceae bacterium]
MTLIAEPACMRHMGHILALCEQRLGPQNAELDEICMRWHAHSMVKDTDEVEGAHLTLLGEIAKSNRF